MDQLQRARFLRWLEQADDRLPEAEKEISFDIKRLASSGPNKIEREREIFTNFIDDTNHTLSNNTFLINRIYTYDWMGSIKGNGLAGSTDAFCISIRENFHYFKLEDLTVRRVELSGNGGTILIQNCTVDKILISGSNGIIKIVNSSIGELDISSESLKIRTLLFEKGCLEGITANPPGSRNPFSGTVNFENVYFPTRAGRRLDGPQPYRNFKALMVNLDNTPAVNLFHSLEHETERHSRKFGLNTIISAFYSNISRYGASTARPLTFLVMDIILTILIIYIFDGTEIGKFDPLGWQNTLIGNGVNAELLRSITLALATTANPVGFLSDHSYVVAKTPEIQLWIIFHGIFSTLCLALFVIALRRKFKIS